MGDHDPILELHERYVSEVVEGLNLCPFARKSREEGRVHRPVFREPVSPRRAAACVERLVAQNPDAEIVLLTFIVEPDHPWRRPEPFEAFTRAVRETYQGLEAPVFYMVAFHPELSGPPPGTALTQDTLVSLLRRTPDPVIQCVSASVLDRVRREAQVAARERMRATLADKDPALAVLFEQSISPDPQLSAEIARRNFAGVGSGEGRDELERRIASILAARRALDGSA